MPQPPKQPQRKEPIKPPNQSPKPEQPKQAERPAHRSNSPSAVPTGIPSAQSIVKRAPPSAKPIAGSSAKSEAARPVRRRLPPQMRAKLSLGIFLLILLSTLLIFGSTLLRRRPTLLQDSGSSLEVEGGEAQMLENFTRPALLPERASTIRLDGVMALQNGESYATFTVDGITATMVADDYLAGYQITDITVSGVTLRAGDEEVMLTLQDNRLEPARSGPDEEDNP